MKFSALSSCFALAGAFALTSTAFASPQNDPATRDNARASTGQDNNSSNRNNKDAALAQWLLIDNQKEIELARIAQQRGSNEEVKQFAQRMIQDHEPMVAKLRKLAGGTGTEGRASDASSGRRQDGSDTSGNTGGNRSGSDTGRDAGRSGSDTTGGRDPNNRGTGSETNRGTGSETSGQTGTNRTGTTGSGNTGTGTTGSGNTGSGNTGSGTTGSNTGTTRTGATGSDTTGSGASGGTPRDSSMTGSAEMRGSSSGGSSDLVALKTALGRECLASATRELQQKQGAEFDACYVSMAVHAHAQMADTLTVFSQQATGELRQAITEAMPTVKAHLEHSKTMAKKFCSPDAKQGTEKSGDHK